jgi:predicted nucleic acid-binding protein
MQGVLLDTNVLSELVRPKPDARVVRFVRDSDAWLCGITFHELTFGAERAPDARRRAKLLAWIGQIKSEFAGRILAVDDEVASASGRLRALAAAQGRPASVVDSIIAAAAQARGVRVATRNVRDFEPFALTVINPWLDL